MQRSTPMQMADHEIHKIDSDCDFDSPKRKKQTKVAGKYRAAEARMVYKMAIHINHKGIKEWPVFRPLLEHEKDLSSIQGGGRNDIGLIA